MNKFRLLAIALVFGAASLFANNVTSPEVSKDEIRKQIIELVDDSKTHIQDETLVKVSFTFSSEGEIVVLKVNTRDKEVRSFVRNFINAKKLENPGVVNKVYTMPILIK